MSTFEAMRVRPLGPVHASHCDAIAAWLPYHFGDAEGRRQCAAAVRHQQGLIAEHDSEVLAFLTYTRALPTATEVTWLTVRAHRRRFGVGSLLVKTLVARLNADRCPLLVVWTRMRRAAR